MDALLKGALKKTSTYTPPVEITRWAEFTKTVRADLAKLTMLTRDKDGNAAAILKVLRGLKDPLNNLAWLMRGYDAAKFKALPAVADWGKVVTEADGIKKLLVEPSHTINGL